ncbi:MAG TPA: ECF-type sigma factor [Bryobacteraceae bacterium]
MNSSAAGEVTRLLMAWRGGQEEALNRLVPMLYAELRQAAHRSRRRQGAGQTLQTTALVNEAFVKLAQAAEIAARDRAHFLALCAQVMRRILVDAARARLSTKRGGGAWRVQLNENVHAAELTPGEVARLDDALTTLARVDPRKSKAIEMRFFGGLSVEETAQVLGVSRETALRDWRFARAWLKSEMNGVERDRR